ncbi:MAG TPA: hypothetical protein VGJ55_20020, partial [Pyrinomonadaceae bacterium]
MPGYHSTSYSSNYLQPLFGVRRQSEAATALWIAGLPFDIILIEYLQPLFGVRRQSEAATALWIAGLPFDIILIELSSASFWSAPAERSGDGA